MTFDDKEMTRKVTPSKPILDFSVFGENLSTEEKFRAEVQKIVNDEKLPLVFPMLPDYFKGRNEGLVTNLELRDSELSLPPKLYDSETYITNPELRVPMEEIILAYEKERIRQALSKKVVLGNTWSPTFVKRFEAVHNLKLSKTELIDGLGDGDEGLDLNDLKGTKLG